MFNFLFSILKVFVFYKFFKWIFNVIFNTTERSTTGNSSDTNTNGKRIPKRIKINEKWYDVHEGWAGTLNLSEWMNPTKYTAKEPYIHINNFYFVYDMNGVKIGEIDIANKSYKGSVTGFEM